MRIRLAICLASIVGIGSVGNVSAQDNWHAALGVSAIYSTQPAGTIPGGGDPGVPNPAISGSAAGFVVDGEIKVSRILGIGVEVSDPARFTAIQTAGRSPITQVENRHRDLIVSALAQFHFPIASRVALVVVGGASYIQEDTLQRIATMPSSSSTFGSYGPERSFTRDTFGGTGGLALEFRVARHLSLGPTLRAHYIHRAELFQEESGGAILGLSPMAFRFGGTMRVTF